MGKKQEEIEALTLVTEIKLQTWVFHKAGIFTKKDVRNVLNVLSGIGKDDTINASLDDLEKIKDE